jgi:hypothetical protein
LSTHPSALERLRRDPLRRNFAILNVLGGVLVLASYGWGAIAASTVMTSLWGGVPEAIRPLYTVNMFLSAAGYFFFAPYILLRVDTERLDILGRFGYSLFSKFMLLVLVPSACWLPLTSIMLAQPSLWIWVVIRVVLGLVAVGSLGLFISLWSLRPPRAPGHVAAVIGLVPFCLQTVLLDALIWPAYFTY